MSLRIHNTLSGNLEELVPGGTKRENIKDYPPVTIYSCGPTVYSYAHIGNFRTFVFNDFLRRYLRFRGFAVDHAMNITDIDDKTIAGAVKEGVSLNEYTSKYTDIFFEDCATLNIETAEHLPRATESIDAMIDIIDQLHKKGLVYEKDGSIYFSISKYNNYGKLSRLDSREIKNGARYDADEYDKDDARDFVLWKAPKEGEPFWETPFGKGRPGWHIECSAMVRKIFKRTIDIHTGGVDLVFPHHENEIAQSEAAYSEKFVRYWIHVEHLLVEGSKMSKSLGNFYTLRDLLEKGYSARAIRYVLLTAHYRKQLNFTLEGLTQANQALERIDNCLLRLAEVSSEGETRRSTTEMCEGFLENFAGSVDNDLNISAGMGDLFDFIHKINNLVTEGALNTPDADRIRKAFEKVDSVMGFIFFKEEAAEIDETEIQALIEKRAQAKKDRDFSLADKIRDELLERNIILEDTKDGTRWKIKK